jgi:hypothetical protein
VLLDFYVSPFIQNIILKNYTHLGSSKYLLPAENICPWITFTQNCLGGAAYLLPFLLRCYLPDRICLFCRLTFRLYGIIIKMPSWGIPLSCPLRQWLIILSIRQDFAEETEGNIFVK